DRLPFNLAKVEILARLNGDVGLREFTKNAVGKRMQRVSAGTNIGDGEFAILVAVIPELIKLGIMGPVDGGTAEPAKTTAPPSKGASRCAGAATVKRPRSTGRLGGAAGA